MAQTQIRVPWPNWKIVSYLGGGSFGAVYEIQRQILGGGIEKAALKVISVPREPGEAQELLTSGYDLRSINQRFLDDLQDISKEYSMMAQLKGNANIVYCDDLQHEPKEDGIGWNLYIKMELLTPLAKVLIDPVSDAQVVKVGMDLCNALAACKKKNIIHRDIKPANIMVSADGNFKLGDFGVAKTTERTAGGTKTGTYNFMAPEVYNNQPYGTAVDIYSLGMVLYWMLNERCGPFLPLPPTVPKASQLDDAKQRRFSGEPLPAPAHGSSRLQKIVLKACAFRPADRYSSPEEMHAALASVYNSVSGKEPYSSPSDRTVPGDTWNYSGYEASQPSGSIGKDDQSVGNSWDNEYEGTEGTSRTKDRSFFSGGTVPGEPKSQSQNGIVYGPYDIKGKLTVTAQEAAQGCTKTVSIAASGKRISVKVPAGTRNGQTLRMLGQGKEDPATGARGTLYLEVKVDQATADFWNQNPSASQNKSSIQESIVIGTGAAGKGCSVKYQFKNGTTKMINIPAGCKNGQIVDSVTIYVHDTSSRIKKKDMEALPDVVLQQYANTSFGGCLAYGIAFIVWLIFGMSTMLIPVMAIGMSLSLLAVFIWNCMWNVRRDEAKRILQMRKNGCLKHK